MSGETVARASPVEDAEVKEYLGGLPEQRLRIARMRMASVTIPQIAKELGISESTVERELAAMRKELKDAINE